MSLLKTRCQRCGHEWVIRTENPLKCPRCGHIRNARIRSKAAGTPGQQNPATLGPSTSLEVK